MPACLPTPATFAAAADSGSPPAPAAVTVPAPGDAAAPLHANKLRLEIAGGNGDRCESLPISPVYLCTKNKNRSNISTIASKRNARGLHSLDVGVFASNLYALLLGPLACDQCLYIVLHRIVDELVLRLRLHHAGTLRTHHLDSALYVDFGVEACRRVEQCLV